MVLLKNGKTDADKIVPLPKKVKKIVVAGRHANDMGWQCGGFSLTWQGFNGTGEDMPTNTKHGLPTGKIKGNLECQRILIRHTCMHYNILVSRIFPKKTLMESNTH